jgi:4-hydroxybenzoate polyprenyltransferase
LNSYLRLIRLHQPTGIWLLLWPCWWGVLLAGAGAPSLRLLVLFGVGAVVMRGAGCIVNDWWDRDFDRQVERTRARPLASGELTVRQAGLMLTVLLSIALLIALQLPRVDMEFAAASLVLVVLYPLMKRITWWPQAFLGLTFNWGALMGYAAVRGQVEAPALLLYAAGFFWTLGYDTIYAFQDMRDDARAGVKSTALRLGSHSRTALWVFYALTFMLLALAGYARGTGMAFYPALLLPAAQVGLVLQRLKPQEPEAALRAFRANTLTATLIGWALLLGNVLK